jgi:trehalose 6-phosphate phosphatase
VALPVPTTDAGRRGLEAILARPARAVIAVDFDGTLAPIVDDPTTSAPLPGVMDVLARLDAVVARVAVVTGRPALVAAELTGLASAPADSGVVVLGGYGRESWSAGGGGLAAPPVPRDLVAAREALADVLLAAEAPPGTTVEDKGAAFAVHVRRTDDPSAAFQRLIGPLTELADRHGLRLEPGRHVLELRPPGIDKGDAVRALAEAGAAVLYAGDDLGDLAAYEALDELRVAGTLDGVTVCSASAEQPALAERADLVVDGPQGVADLLTALVEQLGG